MRRLIPRDVRFFDDFERQSEHLVRAASLLHELLTEFSDVPRMVKAIRDVEHAGELAAIPILISVARRVRPKRAADVI